MAGKEYTAREQREMERVEQAAAETKQRGTDGKIDFSRQSSPIIHPSGIGTISKLSLAMLYS